MDSKTLLIIDDDTNIIKSLSRELMDEEYEIMSAESAEEGLEIVKKETVQVVIVDERMPGMGGNTFLTILLKEYPDIVRIMLTGQANIDALITTINKGEVYRFFTKPWRSLDIVFAVRQAFEKYFIEEERRILLATVKTQEDELGRLEKQFPGITDIRKDEEGAIILPELSDNEVSEIMQQCRERETDRNENMLDSS